MASTAVKAKPRRKHAAALGTATAKAKAPHNVADCIASLNEALLGHGVRIHQPVMLRLKGSPAPGFSVELEPLVSTSPKKRARLLRWISTEFCPFCGERTS